MEEGEPTRRHPRHVNILDLSSNATLAIRLRPRGTRSRSPGGGHAPGGGGRAPDGPRAVRPPGPLHLPASGRGCGRHADSAHKLPQHGQARSGRGLSCWSGSGGYGWPRRWAAPTRR
ncbi:hypothetical protein DEJ46_00175 [Streptomyces venezuelae]|uniref:Uncharacterized protein n=1 Tax=Streptomyces venezuelae TaxID=54571 RepID=A0A5P2AHX1_STRVZ|nr:hypothetical protein DEJ46_00175 [Streptomyces venezuelae]